MDLPLPLVSLSVYEPGLQPPFGPQSGAGIDNENTRLAYRNDVFDCVGFAGIERPEEMREVTRARLEVEEEP